MRFAVDRLGHRRVGRVDQAEPGAAPPVEPIGHTEAAHSLLSRRSGPECCRGARQRDAPSGAQAPRALLGYLALTRSPQRREQLCDMFWEVSDDPRGPLRWSLSKIRPLVDEPSFALPAGKLRERRAAHRGNRHRFLWIRTAQNVSAR
jgi:hypothetical protein